MRLCTPQKSSYSHVSQRNFEFHQNLHQMTAIQNDLNAIADTLYQETIKDDDGC